jgi:ABC-type polysaccharide/polyol phosphate transport system ATPase subunit
MIAVSFDHVSKRYRGARRYTALRDDLAGVAQRLIGVRRPPREVVEALEDVTFEVEQGDSIALMGPNGSGKTTALKIMSRITYPTTGVARVRGRVGALIEVGTGLHPELTGRENIQLYGRILGLSGSDIRRRFDRIVEFADLGSAIDQPVKQFSSGMQLRLGFSLAAHLEPDILLVDEAVSVGDAGFQHRCLERMRELVKAGVTLLFVSHVPSLVAGLCERGVLLDRGRTAMIAPISEIIDSYLALVMRGNTAGIADKSGLTIRSWDWHFRPTPGRFLGDLQVQVEVGAEGGIRNPKFGVALSDGRPGNLVACTMLSDGFETGELSGPIRLRCEMRELPLEPGPYAVWFSAMTEKGVSYLLEPRFLGYAVLDSGANSRASEFAGTSGYGAVSVPYRWEVEKGSDASGL